MKINTNPIRKYFFVFLSAGILAGGLWFLTGGVGPSPAEAVLYQPLNNYRPKDHAIVRKDGVWHVYAIYVCIDQTPPCDTTPKGLMHLTSTDLTNWTEVGYVVPPGASGAWDDSDIWAPSIVERNGTYYMFYTGVADSTNYVQKIGVATSTDLYTWTKHPGNPVLNCDDFTWAHYNEAEAFGAACRDPYVYWDETEHQWVMFMSARTTDDTPTTNSPTIGIATSEDLLTWREYGFIPTTNDYTAESPHVIERNGTYYLVFTDNCSPQPCLKYVSSTNLYSGYGAQSDSGLEDNAYASDYAKDRDGREYFTRIDGTTNLRFDFDELIWSGTPFTVQEPSFGVIGDAVWNDADADGIYDGGEIGLDGVTVRLYLDDGDGVFDPTSDDLYATQTTGDDPNTGGTQQGYYRFTNVLPNDYWVHLDPTNYAAGNALAGFVPTTANATTSVTVTDNLTVSNIDIGLTAVATAWPLTTSANFTVNGEATLSAGRASTKANNETAGWWDPNWQYRRQITVAAVNEILTTSHTVDIAFDTSSLVSGGKLQSDLDDLRLVYWNGSTNAEVDLDVLNGNTQRFKIQTQINASSSDAGYYLYYGNPEVAKRPVRLANVYDYYVSFNQADSATYGAFEEMGDTNWVVSGNKYRYNATTVADRFARDTSKTIDLTDDWQLESTMTINSGQIGGLSFFDTASPMTNADRYYANFDATNNRTQFFHYYFGQVGGNTAHTIDTGIAYRTRFNFIHLSSSFKSLSASLNDNGAGSAIEGTTGYDIFYPSNADTAHPALGTFNGNVTFNDLKGWQLSDSSVTVASEAALYPTRNGTIELVSGQAVPFGKLTEFRASSLEQGGTTRYVLSNDGGATWYYYTGAAWSVSNGTSGQANTAAEIQSNAATFPAGGKELLWKSLLTASAVNQFPMLFQVGASVNVYPSAPTLLTPAAAAPVETLSPTFTVSATDPENEHLQYELQIDTTSAFDSANLRTYAQSNSQAGWSGQDVGGTHYSSGATATFTVPTPLGNGTHYWRVRAVDPTGSNTHSDYSATRTLVTPAALSLGSILGEGTSPTTAAVSWLTNNPGTSTVEYGLTVAYGLSASATANVTAHSLQLTDLVPESTYHFRVQTTDIYGQVQTSADQTVRIPRKYGLPTPTLVTPSPESFLKSYRPLVTGNARSGNTVFILIDQRLEAAVRATSHPSGVGHFAYRFKRDLSPGRHQIQLIARDDASGEISRTSAGRGFITYPDVRATILNPAAGQTFRTRGVTVTGLGWSGHEIAVFIDGTLHGFTRTADGRNGIGPFEYYTDLLARGQRRVHVRMRAPDGTVMLASRARSFTMSGEVLTHIVQAGDSLWSIAARYYGSGSRYPQLIADNRVEYPNLGITTPLRVGLELIVIRQ